MLERAPLSQSDSRTGPDAQHRSRSLKWTGSWRAVLILRSRSRERAHSGLQPRCGLHGHLDDTDADVHLWMYMCAAMWMYMYMWMYMCAAIIKK